jgi:hypothetical protein
MAMSYILYQVTPEKIEMIESGLGYRQAKREAEHLASQKVRKPVRLKWQRRAADLEVAATGEGEGFYVEKYR